MEIKKLKKIQKNKGSLTLLAIGFSAVLIMVFSSLTGFIFSENKLNLSKSYREKSIQIAEAGLDYYKWFLSHYPLDFQDGTGESGPYEHEYSDPENSTIGKFSLEVVGNTRCGEVYSVDITSTGSVYSSPSIKRSVYGRYSRPSVAEYFYIINSNVWAGSTRNIKGKYHSNGGIRMDGENQSIVSSGVSSWTCTNSFGCSPDETVDGVFGSGSGSTLWKFPVTPVDFNGITLDLVNMKNISQTNGLYLSPSGKKGYHLILKNDGTVDVYKVTRTRGVKGYSSEEGWQYEYNIIRSESFVNNYELPSSCGLVFVEDFVWLEGTVKNKVTIASADLISANKDTDIYLVNNLDYTTEDGSDGLTAIAENSILIPLNSPDNMKLSGIFIAQKGKFGRNHYYEWYLPWSYWDYVKRNSLEITGTIVSNGRVGTSWSCGGSYCSGYASRINSYDRKQSIDPPPLTPFTDSSYRFIEWREE